MTTSAHNLLNEPLFSIRVGQSSLSWSLPEVLTGLSTNADIEFEALQPHQQHPWHAFLTQLAAIALHRHGVVDLPTSSAVWTAYLLDLTDGRNGPWSLIVEDFTQPAFMQPSIPDIDAAPLKTIRVSPDQIDVLITTRNHDIKDGRMSSAAPEEWAYALITLQTSEGFSGRLNYGIARMNGGFSSRPCVAAARSTAWSTRFQRDTAVWLEHRSALLNLDANYRGDGATLLWLLPWDGTTSISTCDLDPFFIEICRRARLTQSGNGITAQVGNSRVPRVAAKELHGNTGDIWTPVARDGAALTVAASGFDYQLVARILFSDDFAWNPALNIRPDDGSAPIVICRTLVRGQGLTDGWRQRLIHIPPPVVPLFGSLGGRSRLAELSQRRVADSGTFLRRALTPALCALLQGAPDTLNFRDDRIPPWRQQADARIDRAFFPMLWEDIALSHKDQDVRWRATLAGIGSRTLYDAVAAAPVPHARRYRAIAAAERVYYGALKKTLPLENGQGGAKRDRLASAT